MQEGEALRCPPALPPPSQNGKIASGKKKQHKNHRWNAYLTVRCVTAVLERALLCRRRFTRRYFGLSEIQCLCVSWLQLSVNMRKRWWTKKKKKKNCTSMDTEIWAVSLSDRSWMRERERVRYRIRALLHLAEAPFISETESRTKWKTHKLLFFFWAISEARSTGTV